MTVSAPIAAYQRAERGNMKTRAALMIKVGSRQILLPHLKYSDGSYKARIFNNSVYEH